MAKPNYDITGLILAAMVPLAYWQGLEETARTACLILILHWGNKP